MTNPKDIEKDMRYLQLLSNSFPTIADASTEIINLQAILNLPKGTEHFLADIHGEYEAFQHVLKNASGNIKRKVNDLFGTTLREAEKRELCTLIYYPEQKLELVKAQEKDIDDWYHITLHKLVAVCRDISSKYTRSKVRHSLPADFSYIIEELLHERTEDINKTAYVNEIIDTIISTGRADDFIIAMAGDTAIGNRPTSPLGRHLRSWSWCSSHHGLNGKLRTLGHHMGQPRHYVDGCCCGQ